MRIAVFYFFACFTSCLNSAFAQMSYEDPPMEELVMMSQTPIMNYPTNDSILQYKKLEIGIPIPGFEQVMITNFLKKARVPKQNKINPFLEWDIDVELTFTHVKSGKVVVVDAFYYREYERDTLLNDWVEQETIFPFRARFCPTELGEWRYSVEIVVQGKSKYNFLPVYFNVVSCAAHGFVKVHDNHKNLELDNQIIIPIGQNLIAPVNGVDSYTVKADETHKAALVDDWLSYHKDIADFHALGGKYIRTVQTAWSSLIEFEEKGNYYNRLHYAWEQDRLLEFCEENDMLMNFNFMFQEPIMSYGQYYSSIWDFGHYSVDENHVHSYNENDAFLPYCYNDDGKEEPHNMFLDEDDLKYHEMRMRYYISRYGYSTSIMVFELLSEPMHLDQFFPYDSFEMKDDEHGKTVRKALYNYNNRMSSYIKNTMGHTDHLIGLHAFDNTIFWQDTVAQKILDESCGIPTIDVIGFSTYKNNPNRLIITKHNRGLQIDEDENSYYQYMNRFWSRYDKPVMHFEQGSSGDASGANENSNFTPHEMDMRTIGFTGCAGFFVWEGYIHIGSRDQRVAWLPTVVAEKWMNSDTVINVLKSGEWVQGRQAERSTTFKARKTKETQYLIDSLRENAVGFVLNRTYNSYTMALTTEIQNSMPNPGEDYNVLQNIGWKDGNRPLYVSGLLGGRTYSIEWYDYKNGAYITGSVETTKRNGELKLKFPELLVESSVHTPRPMVWFRISIIEEDNND